MLNMSVAFLVYTVGTGDVGRIRIAKGVDQRFGRLDIVARIVDVLSDELYRSVFRLVIVYVRSMEIAVYIDVDAIGGKGFQREVDVYNIILQCLNRSTFFCSRVKTSFELLLEMLQTRYRIVVLTEEGERISQNDVFSGTVYIVGAEEDPPKNIVARYRRLSVGPLVYQADQVVSYMAWIVRRRLSGPIPA